MIRNVDYGMGNLRSVQKGFEKLGIAAEIVTQPEQIDWNWSSPFENTFVVTNPFSEFVWDCSCCLM